MSRRLLKRERRFCSLLSSYMQARYCGTEWEREGFHAAQLLDVAPVSQLPPAVQVRARKRRVTLRGIKAASTAMIDRVFIDECAAYAAAVG